MRRRVSKEHLREDLEDHIDAIVNHYHPDAVLRGANYRLTKCPMCGEASSREAVAVSASTGEWIHHGRERAVGGECQR